MSEWVPFTENAKVVLAKRYLRRGPDGRAVETPEGMLERVAKAVAEAERAFGADGAKVAEVERAFLGLLARREFLPNSPTLMNAGRPGAQLAACFVLPVEDSLDGVFATARLAAHVQKTGGGTGYDLSRLRPHGDLVGNVAGAAGGPLPFLKLFDATSDAIRQGGVRRGASMGVLPVHHPDILEFIAVKGDGRSVTNFNLSVLASRAFLEAVDAGTDYALINPRTGKEVKRLDARRVYDAIVRHAWATGEPGLLFEERIEQDNFTPALGHLAATNPCGEQPLLAYESCTLGSLNLSRFISNGAVDLERLASAARTAVRFLDDVIEANTYPSEEIRRATLATRKVGLGVMGFADLLIALGVPYDSADALAVADRVMGTIARAAREASEALAAERGPFPAFGKSTLKTPRRNTTMLAIAPTGTISVIAGCSFGIEPLYAVAFTRNVLDGEVLREVHPAFEAAMERAGRRLTPALFEQLAHEGLAHADVPPEIRTLFRGAHDIAPSWHVRMQAAFQAHVDSAVSKTVNLPKDAPVEAAREAYDLARKLGCKGITIYRDGSREGQVLAAAATHAAAERCPECDGPVAVSARCSQCTKCGWGKCG